MAERGDRSIAGILPLTEIRSPIFGKALVSAGFGTDGGVLGDAGAVASLAAAAWALAERLDIASVELRGGPVPDAGWTVEDSTYVGFVKPLAADDEAELQVLTRNRRATVRKALKQGHDIRTGSSARDLADHYAVYSESVRNLGTPVFPRALFAEVLRDFGEGADILTVVGDGEPMASVLSLYMNGVVYPYWGGSTAAGKARLAADAMYFGVMRHAAERGCHTYDFGRSKAGTGTATYKTNWSFEPTPLSYATRTRPGAAPRVVNPNSPKYALQVAAWKRLPLWAANAIGPQLSRGLG